MKVFFTGLLILALGTVIAGTLFAQESSLRGTGDLGIVIERATGSLLIIDSTTRTAINRVDELGDLEDAIAYAAKKSGIKNKKVLYYPIVEQDPIEEFIEQLENNESLNIKSTTALPESLVKHYEKLKVLESYQGIQMRMPYIVEFN